MRKRKARLGLGKNVREFNISTKKRLQDPLLLLVNGGKVNKSVASWISSYPKRLYEAVYDNNEVELTRDSIQLLKSQLHIHFPHLLEAINKRRQNHRFKAFSKELDS